MDSLRDSHWLDVQASAVEVGQQAELQTKRVQVTPEALLVCLGCGFQGKGSNGDLVFNHNDAAVVLAQVVAMELNRK